MLEIVAYKLWNSVISALLCIVFNLSRLAISVRVLHLLVKLLMKKTKQTLRPWALSGLLEFLPVLLAVVRNETDFSEHWGNFLQKNKNKNTFSYIKIHVSVLYSQVEIPHQSNWPVKVVYHVYVSRKFSGWSIIRCPIPARLVYLQGLIKQC